MKDQQEIYESFVNILTEEFELDRNSITLDSHLYQELGLDSIDAVDLIVKLQELVGRKINPETFKRVRTIQDAVLAIDAIVNKDG